MGIISLKHQAHVEELNNLYLYVACVIVEQNVRGFSHVKNQKLLM